MGSSDLAAADGRRWSAARRTIGRSAASSARTRRCDLDLLRRALGVEKLTLDGVSYGTSSPSGTRSRYPGHVAGSCSTRSSRTRGSTGCGRERERGRACAAPRLPRTPLPGRSRRRPRLVVRAARHRHGPARRAGDAERDRPDLPGRPGALHAARMGNRVALERLVAAFGPDPRTPAEALSQGLHASALCADNPMPWGGPATPSRSALPLSPRASRSPAASLWPFPATSRPVTGSSARASTGRPSRRRRFRAESCPRCRRCCSPATTTCRRRSPWARQELARPRGQARRRPQGRPLGAAAGSQRDRAQAVNAFLHAGAHDPRREGRRLRDRREAVSFRATDGLRLHGVLLGSGPKGIVLATSSAPTCATGCLSRSSSRPRLPRARLRLARGQPTQGHLERDVLGAVRELLRRGVTRSSSAARRPGAPRRWGRPRRSRARNSPGWSCSRRRGSSPRWTGSQRRRDRAVVLRRRQPGHSLHRRDAEALRRVGGEEEAAARRPLVGARDAAARHVVGAGELQGEAPRLHRRRVPLGTDWGVHSRPIYSSLMAGIERADRRARALVQGDAGAHVRPCGLQRPP